MHRHSIGQHLELALRRSLDAPALRLIDLAGERPAVDERREPSIPIKYGPASPDDWFGVVPAVARFQRSPAHPAESLSLVVKVNPREGLARTLIPWIIEHAKIALDRPYWEYRTTANPTIPPRASNTSTSSRPPPPPWPVCCPVATELPPMRPAAITCCSSKCSPTWRASTPLERAPIGRRRWSMKRCDRRRGGMLHSGTSTANVPHGPDHDRRPRT